MNVEKSIMLLRAKHHRTGKLATFGQCKFWLNRGFESWFRWGAKIDTNFTVVASDGGTSWSAWADTKRRVIHFSTRVTTHTLRTLEIYAQHEFGHMQGFYDVGPPSRGVMAHKPYHGCLEPWEAAQLMDKRGWSTDRVHPEVAAWLQHRQDIAKKLRGQYTWRKRLYAERAELKDAGKSVAKVNRQIAARNKMIAKWRPVVFGPTPSDILAIARAYGNLHRRVLKDQ